MTPITPEILQLCGFEKDGFGCWNISIANFEGELKQLSFHGDYLFLRHGTIAQHRHKDDIVTVWNKDTMKVFPLEQLQALYFGITGRHLTPSL